MTSPDLTADELATLARFDATPHAPESLVERVAKAMCNGDAEDLGCCFSWTEINDQHRDAWRRSAQHAINAMRGEPLSGAEALRDVAWALVKRCDRMLNGWAEATPDVRSRDLWQPLHSAADDLRAALEGPR